ncbi:MAG: hypothetical protein ABJB47_01475 [Actinomycetota bacterium]
MALVAGLVLRPASSPPAPRYTVAELAFRASAALARQPSVPVGQGCTARPSRWGRSRTGKP